MWFYRKSYCRKTITKKSNYVIVIDDLSTGNYNNLVKKKNIKFVKYDISKNLKKIEKLFYNVSAIYHLAALADIVPSIEKPKNYFDANVVGTFNLLQIAFKYKIKKFIYAASSSCYGIPKKYPTDEKSEIFTKYPYALTKKLGEDLVRHWSEVYKINCVSLRLFNVYGPRARTLVLMELYLGSS